MMQYEDAAKFVYSIAKRARKYGLGLTTISQDVEDFLGSNYGKAVVSNAAMQFLLKQSPTAIDKLQQVFYLTDGEKQFLLSAGIGEGIFFAGANHVAIQVVASQTEYDLINTNPTETFKQQPEADTMDITAGAQMTSAPTPTPAPAPTTTPLEQAPSVQADVNVVNSPSVQNSAVQNDTAAQNNNSLTESL